MTNLFISGSKLYLYLLIPNIEEIFKCIMEKVWMCLPNFAKRASCMLYTSSQDEGFSIGASKIEYETEGDVACIASLSVDLK